MNTKHILPAFAAVLTAAATFAQTPPPRSAAVKPEETITLEAVTVTGSNLIRIEQEKALPISVLTQDILEARDASTPIELMSTMPQMVNVPLNETSTLGAGARGDNSSISLRGIGSAYTLPLLNNRRLAPHPISAAENTVPALSVNVNQLPNRGIDRIEVLRDGASSIYGTDAVAGVVNYITDRNYRGTELRARYGYNPDEGGDEYRGTVLFGREFAQGKGRLVATVDVFRREATLTRDRSFSADADQTYRAPPPWNDYNSDTDFFARSSGSAFGNFTVGNVSSGGVFTGVRPTGVPTTLTTAGGAFFLVPSTTPSGVAFKTTTPTRVGIERDYYYNLNAHRVITPKSFRTSWFSSLEYDLTPQLTAFADLLYYKAESDTYREPDSASRATDGEILIPAANPWNPFGARFFSPTGAPNADGTARLTGTPSAVRIENKRFLDFGRRVAHVESDSFRIVGGLRGKLTDSWNWETAGLYNRATTSDVEQGAIRQSLFSRALQQTTNATAYNPFGYEFAVQGNTVAVVRPYENPRSIIDTFQMPFIREGRTELASWDIRASGNVYPIWGGNSIQGGLGGEYRYETYDDERPEFAGLNPAGSGLNPLDNDFLAFSPNPDTHADRNVAAVYGELVIPLVGGKFTLPLVQSLELSASARYEKYSDFGDTTKPKVGLTWRPVDWLLVRASYNEGFRAPNLAQLFTGELVRSVVQTDTYRSNVTGLPSDGSTSRLFRRSGNQNLSPEEAIDRSAGIVVQVPFVKGLSFSADYWEIRQTGVIGTTGGVTEDAEALNAATQAALGAGTAIGSIDLGSGTATYAGDPSVVRRAVTQADRDAFAAYNATRTPANQRATVGAIDFIKETYFNRSEAFVNGLDLEATYRLPKLNAGYFTLNTEWSYIIDSHLYESPGAPRDDRRGSTNAAKWKGTSSVTWRSGAWRAGLTALYTGDFIDADGSTTAAVYSALGEPGYIRPQFDTGLQRYRFVVDDTLTWNGYVSYRIKSESKWLGETTVRVGGINITGVEPPLAADSRGYSTSVYGSLARGRIWSLELSRKF